MNRTSAIASNWANCEAMICPVTSAPPDGCDTIVNPAFFSFAITSSVATFNHTSTLTVAVGASFNKSG